MIPKSTPPAATFHKPAANPPKAFQLGSRKIPTPILQTRTWFSGIPSVSRTSHLPKISRSCLLSR